VLEQPFPTFPLIGPRNPAELDIALGALSVELATDDLAWLRSGRRGDPEQPARTEDHS
jgi:aryl-alcohol dehydrogenase-like predicted oxidoreductase